MSPTTFHGGCLCGAVRYEIQGDPTRFYHCHCTRCRKSSGAGHASNAFLEPATLKWLQGEELVKSFKLPEAKRFTRQFCATCGSPLPRVVQGSNIVILPAGSLDSELTLKPQSRIFWDSRASWSCSGDDLPVHATYPG